MLLGLSNPNQNPNNMMQMTSSEMGCCNTTGEVCKNTLEIPEFSGLASITFVGSDGVERTLEVPATITTPLELKQWLLSIAELPVDARPSSDGCCTPGTGFGTKICFAKGSGDGIEITTNAESNGVVLCITSDLTFVSVNDGATDIPFEKICQQKLVCKCQIQIAADEAGAEITNNTDGNSVALGAYAEGDDALLKADVETALGTLGVPFSDVVVEFADGVFTVSVYVIGEGCGIFGIAGNPSINCGCESVYMADAEKAKAKEFLALRTRTLKNKNANTGGAGKIKVTIKQLSK